MEYLVANALEGWSRFVASHHLPACLVAEFALLAAVAADFAEGESLCRRMPRPSGRDSNACWGVASGLRHELFLNRQLFHRGLQSLVDASRAASLAELDLRTELFLRDARTFAANTHVATLRDLV